LILLDDILLSPARGLMWIFRSVHKAVQEELDNERANTRARLSELYLQLERGEITDEEFDKEESLLLDRLDALKEGPE
jgi:Gas vesicle protein G